MSTNIESKLKKFLQSSIPGTVCLASWLEKTGISRDLQKRYRKSGWLESIGTGAFIKPKDNVGWEGGIFAIQEQLNAPIYPGALTAIALQGHAHYIRMGKENLHLFALPHTILPRWFKTHKWRIHIPVGGYNPLISPTDTNEVDIRYHSSNFLPYLPYQIDLSSYRVKDFTIKISSLERAILECLYLAPHQMDLVECYQIMEGLNTLRPDLLQELLEGCNSIKVTRLFLYMAEKANHAWLKYLDTSKFNVGKGDRSIVKNGVYVASHHITIPKELASYV